MPAPKPLHRKATAASEADTNAAQRYLEAMAGDETLTPDEIREIEDSIEEVRQGRMTLAEFERRYDL